MFLSTLAIKCMLSDKGRCKYEVCMVYLRYGQQYFNVRSEECKRSHNYTVNMERLLKIMVPSTLHSVVVVLNCTKHVFV